MNRRTFLAAGAGVAAMSSAMRPAQASARLPIKKAVEFEMLPKDMSIADRFQMAHDAGFAEIECPTMPDEHEAEDVKKAAEKTGLRIHSVMNMAHWQYPLSSADPAVVAESVKGMQTSLRNAHFWGADTVLLVPAVVNAQTSYHDAWVRSQEQIRKFIPMAQELKVIIGIEEVWNKFLLSPLEMARYIDEFNSPWIRSYFDVGNVVIFGYPQDWIRTLGKRIVKLHIKDFKFEKREVAEWVPLREGEIKWPEVYKALADIGYTGSATVELNGGDAAYLKEVNRRFDLILTGA
ncbi:MAG TPA: sugar phosphate isomerase/epimerase family protein [Bryobacteraceae bacterium]|nr:sugar phosphate isomerase/epimerase family protein [Bryobacteraceae bacterium]